MNAQLALIESAPVAFFTNETTDRNYRSDLKHFMRWTREVGRPGLPASGEDIAEYVHALRRAREKLSTIRRRLSTLSHWHRFHDISTNPRFDPRVKLALRQAVIEDERGHQRKLAYIDDAIRKIVLAMDDDFHGMTAPTPRTALAHVRDRAIILVMFTAALSNTELRTLDVENIRFNARGAELQVNASGFRRGTIEWQNPMRTRTVSILDGRDPLTCPVTALRRWLVAASVERGPAFRGLHHDGSLVDGYLNAKSLYELVRTRAKLAGESLERISTHSLRSGLAATVALRGGSDDLIRAQMGLQTTESIQDVLQTARALGRHANDFLRL